MNDVSRWIMQNQVYIKNNLASSASSFFLLVSVVTHKPPILRLVQHFSFCGLQVTAFRLQSRIVCIAVCAMKIQLLFLFVFSALTADDVFFCCGKKGLPANSLKIIYSLRSGSV
jgi:hypothetical protein